MLTSHFHLLNYNLLYDTSSRSLSFRFEEQQSCRSWFEHLKRALNNRREAPHRPPPPPPKQNSMRKSLYPQMQPETSGSVPPAVERCISHITTHGKFFFVRSVCLSTRMTDHLSFGSQASTWRVCTGAAALLPRSHAWWRLW